MLQAYFEFLVTSFFLFNKIYQTIKNRQEGDKGRLFKELS